MSIDELLERLDDEATSLSGRSFDCQDCGISSNLATEAAATIRALREALKPFAQAAKDCLCDEDKDDWGAWEHAISLDLTLRDYRRAVTALEASHGRAG